MKRVFLFLTVLSALCSCGTEIGPWSLDRVATMLDAGDRVQIQVCGSMPRSLEWTSTDGKVAQVDGQGEILAQANGDTWIVASDPRTGAKDSCLVTVGYEAQNPILPPSWGLYIADGEPHVFDGRMYLFGSRDNYDGLGSDGRVEWCSDNYHVIWSDDLLHWTDAGEALNLKDIPEEVKGDGIRLWAPDVFRDPRTGKYHMAACTNNAKAFLLDADRPEGPYTNARTITLNGQELGHIDPGILVDDDGKVYLALPRFIVAQLDPDDYSRILPETVRDMTPFMPTDNEPFEGPSLRKRGDTYYYIYIQNTGKILPDRKAAARSLYVPGAHRDQPQLPERGECPWQFRAVPGEVLAAVSQERSRTSADAGVQPGADGVQRRRDDPGSEDEHLRRARRLRNRRYGPGGRSRGVLHRTGTGHLPVETGSLLLRFLPGRRAMGLLSLFQLPRGPEEPYAQHLHG